MGYPSFCNLTLRKYWKGEIAMHVDVLVITEKPLTKESLNKILSPFVEDGNEDLDAVFEYAEAYEIPVFKLNNADPECSGKTDIAADVCALEKTIKSESLAEFVSGAYAYYSEEDGLVIMDNSLAKYMFVNKVLPACQDKYLTACSAKM